MLKDVSGVWNLSDLTDATSLLLLMSMVKVTNNMQSKKGREEGGGVSDLTDATSLLLLVSKVKVTNLVMEIGLQMYSGSYS